MSLTVRCSEFDLVRSKAKVTKRFYRKMKRVLEIKQKRFKTFKNASHRISGFSFCWISFEGSTQLEEMRVKGALVASGLRKV